MYLEHGGLGHVLLAERRMRVAGVELTSAANLDVRDNDGDLAVELVRLNGRRVVVVAVARISANAKVEDVAIRHIII